MSSFGETYAIPGVYRRPAERAEGFPRLRTDIAGFVGVAGVRHVGEAVAVDDWKSYVTAFRRDDFGNPVPAPAGSVLDGAVRDFFANGGRRLWIVNVAARLDEIDPQKLLNMMLGVDAIEPQGLELLLRQDEVSIVAVPELDARITVLRDRGAPEDLPGDPCFGPCVAANPANDRGPASGDQIERSERLFGDGDLLWAQRYLIDRLLRTSWRWIAILTPPPGRAADGAVDWRRALLKGTEGASVAALYWPWLLAQDSPGASVEERSPVGAVAGIYAQVDIAIGPHAAPANRPISGAVGLASEVGDEENALAYDAGVNVLRDFSGIGIQLWGARTLLWQDRGSRGEALSFVNARRCLSAICRSAEVIGQPMTFQPNTAILRIKLHQLMTDYLLRIFADGALKGATPEEAFFVEVPPVPDTPEGQLVCNIGIALAAPAEFIVFRIGRESGVIERAAAA
ncbi:phage tail sheath subtilisin-like domain-containing protein [Sphingomonas psychrotolerans]|uniref:Tail sheath protein subtilisin-like domain-containing protein n=1 Tax=Sphingomonas psychrotolerans TaxID=1327635 RepID=A0A2K8MGQ3_9SPHN|nr:phage tail sheath subtilisin-like domain-containing protein [Sphingomonas psychrotolerans]ATY30919.1 hypothetical protein CVN68_02060 [Sphingomonas psychrotolerans]